MYGNYGDRFVLAEGDEILERLRLALGREGMADLAAKTEHAAVVPGAYEALVDALANGLAVTDEEARSIIEMMRQVLQAEAPAAPADPQLPVATKTSQRRDSKGRRNHKPYGFDQLEPELTGPRRDSKGRRLDKPNDPRRRA
jgi:hypothetical protein